MIENLAIERLDKSSRRYLGTEVGFRATVQVHVASRDDAGLVLRYAFEFAYVGRNEKSGDIARVKGTALVPAAFAAWPSLRQVPQLPANQTGFYPEETPPETAATLYALLNQEVLLPVADVAREAGLPPVFIKG